MTARDRTERILKDLDKLHKIAKARVVGTSALDDKVAMQRLAGQLLNARRIVFTTIYAIEDAEKQEA